MSEPSPLVLFLFAKTGFKLKISFSKLASINSLFPPEAIDFADCSIAFANRVLKPTVVVSTPVF